MIESGRSPIIEAGMDELVAENHRACRLHATTDSRSAIHESEISFICVGTPSLRNGKLDLSHVESVSREIGSALREKNRHHVIVLRSTVLPGTTESVVVTALENASGLRSGSDFAVCYNPEFIREGSAVSDFLQPPYTILGVAAPEELVLLRELYGGLPCATFETTILVAEMVKYVSNVFHALKV
jgi:GDP-mannose 6-dehydrogenase